MVNTREIAEEYRLTHWAQIMQRRRENGQSIKSFCEAEGIYSNVYYYWQRKLREAACEQLVVAQAEPVQGSLAVTGFTEVKLKELPVPPGMSPVTAKASQISVEINGAKITTDSAYPTDKLAELLRELSRPC